MAMALVRVSQPCLTQYWRGPGSAATRARPGIAVPSEGDDDEISYYAAVKTLCLPELADLRLTLVTFTPVSLFAGGAAACAYALACPEMQAPYVAVWYALGMALPAVAGAALGRWAAIVSAQARAMASCQSFTAPR